MRTSPSGGKYIGQSSRPENIRWKEHCKDAYNKNSDCYNSILSQAIRQYGKDNFSVEILEEDIPVEQIDEKEQYYIQKYNTFYKNNPKFGYNITLGGQSGTFKYSDDFILKLWNTGKTVDPDGTIVTGSFDDIALTATWQINQYTITFDTDGADPIEAITQYYNTAITAPANPAKKGFTFLGWQPALPATMPAQDLTVKAQWRDDRETIAVDFNGTTSFPTDADKFCNGNETSISLPFTITKGQPSEYIVTFENGTVVNGKVDANNNVLIEIPNDLESGVYKGSVVFNGDPELYKESDAYPVAITANIPKNAALQIYSDVLLVDNHDKNYSAYQWYKDGNAISGATLQFYSEPSFSGRYTVKITDKDGKEFMSCPIKTGVSVKNTKSSVKVYPNPATSGEQFTLEIEEYDPAKDYTIMIFTANGTLVKKLTGLEKINTTTLPGGIYSGSLISNGEKSGFKVIVK